MNPELWDVAIFSAAQTGALIYFAGVVATTLKNHDARLEKQERKCDDCTKLVTQLATKEGFQL